MQPYAQQHDLPLDPRSAGSARGLVREFCIRHGFSEDVRDSGLVIASELVTNAVVHVRPRAGVPRECSLLLTWRRRDFEIAVWDYEPSVCPDLPAVEAEAEGGRGLAIVLASAVGFTWMKAVGGKLVAARLRVPPAAWCAAVGSAAEGRL